MTEVPVRHAKYLFKLCCGKADWGVFKGNIIIVCPDHPPMIYCDGELKELRP